MNTAERKVLLAFPNALDESVNEKFPGAECKSSFDLFDSMSMVTRYKGKGARKREIQAYIDGFVAGNLELRSRLEKGGRK